MGRDLREYAEKSEEKAEKLLKAMVFSKAGKLFRQAADTYLKLDEFDKAKYCFMQNYKTSMEKEKFSEALTLLRLAAETDLMTENYSEANEHLSSVVSEKSFGPSKTRADACTVPRRVVLNLRFSCST